MVSFCEQLYFVPFHCNVHNYLNVLEIYQLYSCAVLCYFVSVPFSGQILISGGQF